MPKRLTSLVPSSGLCAVKTAFTIVSFAGALVLTGCGAGRMLPDVSATGSPQTTRGSVHGGQQPVGGAQIQLWAVGTASNASAATPLLTSAVYTDAGGGFGITGDYTCPSATTQVYLTATGGNPGLGGSVNNGALALVAVLGDCGTLAVIPQISVNELTTVAAAYALAPFASGIGQVGAPSTNLAGIRSAMQNAMLLASPYFGNAPSATLPLNATTETAKLVTLANVIATCVNSAGGAQCTAIASDASTPGFGTPADTFQMALMVAQHPGNNVTALYNDAPAQAAFGGSLSAAPNDWSMTISFTGGGLGQPNAVAVDGSGNLWVSNSSGGVSAFDPQGLPLFAAGITTGMGLSSAVTADAIGNVWVANGAFDVLHPEGSVARLDAVGDVLSTGLGYTLGGIDLPDAIAAAPNGRMLVVNSGNSKLTVLSPTGQVVSGLLGLGGGVLSNPSALAVDANSAAWIANKGSGTVVHMTLSGTVLQQSACCATPDSILIDSSGNLWVGDSSAGTVTEVRSDGVAIQTVSVIAVSSPKAMAIDGGSHIFIADAVAGGIGELYDSSSAAAGTRVGQTAVLGMDAMLQSPAGVAVDSSGNVWVASQTDNRLVNFIGMAAPVRTPHIGAPTQP